MHVERQCFHSTTAPQQQREHTFLQNPHAVSIITFLTQVMPWGNHLRGEPGSQPGLCSLWQLTAFGHHA